MLNPGPWPSCQGGLVVDPALQTYDVLAAPTFICFVCFVLFLLLAGSRDACHFLLYILFMEISVIKMKGHRIYFCADLM